MKRIRLYKVLFSLCAIMLPFIFGMMTAGAADSISGKVCCQMPADHFDSKAVELFIKKAEELSNNTISFKFFPAGQLYSEHDLVDVLPKGGVEMAQIGLDRHVGRVPVGHYAYPYFADPDVYYRWWYDKKCGGGIFYDVLKPAFEKDNIKLLSTLNYATTYAIITNKPIRKLEDYKGMKIRSSGKSLGSFLEMLGAKAVVMSSSDVYMALQRGTIDGALSGTSSFVSRKWYEAAKYVQIIPMGNIPFGWAASMKYWNKLSDDQKKVIEEASREMEIWAVKASSDEHDRCVKVMKDAGVEIMHFPKDIENELIKSGLKAVQQVVEPDVGKETWQLSMKYLENARQANGPTWQELLKTRPF